MKGVPSEIAPDAAPVYPAVLDDVPPSAWHHAEQHANDPVEAEHAQLKHRLRPTRGLRTNLIAQIVIAGHAFLRNLHRGHYELRVDALLNYGSPQHSPNMPTRSQERGPASRV